MSQPVPGPRATSSAVADAAATGPVTTGGPPVTGDDAVDEALRGLVDVGTRGPREQLDAFEAVHGALQDRLADAEG